MTRRRVAPIPNRSISELTLACAAVRSECFAGIVLRAAIPNVRVAGQEPWPKNRSQLTVRRVARRSASRRISRARRSRARRAKRTSSCRRTSPAFPPLINRRRTPRPLRRPTPRHHTARRRPCPYRPVRPHPPRRQRHRRPIRQSPRQRQHPRRRRTSSTNLPPSRSTIRRSP